MSEPKSDGTNKFMASDYVWKNAREALLSAERDYALHVFNNRDDVTAKKAKDEFWERAAEFFGFEIKWKRE